MLNLTACYLKLNYIKNESQTNLDQFVNAFDSDKPQENFVKIDNASITDAHFSVIDENKEPQLTLISQN
jgi:hypothetical protein